jgi:hypothetical protein
MPARPGPETSDMDYGGGAGRFSGCKLLRCGAGRGGRYAAWKAAFGVWQRQARDPAMKQLSNAWPRSPTTPSQLHTLLALAADCRRRQRGSLLDVYCHCIPGAPSSPGCNRASSVHLRCIQRVQVCASRCPCPCPCPWPRPRPRRWSSSLHWHAAPGPERLVRDSGSFRCLSGCSKGSVAAAAAAAAAEALHHRSPCRSTVTCWLRADFANTVHPSTTRLRTQVILPVAAAPANNARLRPAHVPAAPSAPSQKSTTRPAFARQN